MLKKTVHRPNHRERAQPLEREKWGVLEKHKVRPNTQFTGNAFTNTGFRMPSYSKRAKDYNEKKARLKILRQKAAERNPDEFTYSMLSSRSKGGRKINDRGNPVLSQDAVKLLKTQDSGYVRTMLSKTRRAVEKLEQEFLLAREGSVEVLGGVLHPDKAQHLLFVDNTEEQKRKLKAPTPSLSEKTLSERNALENNATDASEEETQIVLQKVPKSARAARREKEVLDQEKLLRKQLHKEQNARRAKLAALKSRGKDLTDAENELELQRAKMSNNVGGVTKAGIKWKPRERKR